MREIDNSDRAKDIRSIIQSKCGLLKLYQEFYNKYEKCLKKCPKDGVAIEIGSGAGFLKNVVAEIVTSDILPYDTVDLVMDASKLPFNDRSIKSIFMLNTLHHIADTESLFYEAERCLMPEGRLLIIDQYHGWLSNFIFKYAHHEPYKPNAKSWKFKSSGPLSGANGALCWIIFYRDRALFERLYPSLDIVNIKPNTPLRYWLSGGLKWWQLLPASLFDIATRLDERLSQMFPRISSFVEVELVKKS